MNKKSREKNNLISSISLNEVEKKALICVFFISALSLLSLIQANILYVDDIARVLGNIGLWDDDGRPISSFVSRAIQLGEPLTDISPLPQIISIAFYSLSSIYLGKIFRVNNLFFLSLGGIIFVLNPFNLQNFAYIFDSLTMGLSVFISTAAFFVISIAIERKILNKHIFLIFFLAFLLLLASLCLYQSATSIYIAALTFYSLLKLVQDTSIKQSVKTFVFSMTILLCSLLAYIPIKNFYVKNNYILKKSTTPSLVDIPKTLIKNLIDSIENIYKLLGNSNLLTLIIVLGIAVISTIILLAFKKFLSSIKKSLNLIELSIVICLILIYCFFIIFSFLGLSLVFVNPLYEPRAYMGFSSIIAISCLFLAQLFYPYRFLRFFLIFFLSLLCLSFANVSLTFGNALHAQNTQEEMIATVLLSDLEEEISKFSDLPQDLKIAIAGELKHSALATQAFSKYPILETITKSYFKQGWGHSYQRLESLELNFNSKSIPKEERFMPSSQPILSRRIYDIYFENNDTFVILFKIIDSN